MVNRFEKYGCADVSFGVRWSKLYADDAVVTSVWNVPGRYHKRNGSDIE